MQIQRAILYNYFMPKLLKNSILTSAPVLGFVFLIPFIVLEVVNRWRLNEGFPFSVFAFTWALQAVFIRIIQPIIKDLRSGKSLTKIPINLLLRLAALAFIAYIWLGWITDQWPCFMGIPNCD